MFSSNVLSHVSKKTFVPCSVETFVPCFHQVENFEQVVAEKLGHASVEILSNFLSKLQVEVRILEDLAKNLAKASCHESCQESHKILED